MTIRVDSPADANYSTSDGNEVHRDPPPPPPPVEGPHSGGDGVDMTPAYPDFPQSVPSNPPPSTSSTSPPFEVDVGVELDATAILPQ